MNRTQTQTVGQTTHKMPAPAPQQLMLCTICPHTGTACQAGYAMMQQLQKAISMAGDSVEEGFEISGYAQTDGCKRDCLLAYYGTKDSTYLFGDVAEDEDPDALVTYAKDHQDALNRGIHPEACAPLTRAPASVLALGRGLSLS